MKESWGWLAVAGVLVVAGFVVTQVTAAMPGNAYLIVPVMLLAAWLILRKV